MCRLIKMTPAGMWKQTTTRLWSVTAPSPMTSSRQIRRENCLNQIIIILYLYPRRGESRCLIRAKWWQNKFLPTRITQAHFLLVVVVVKPEEDPSSAVAMIRSIHDSFKDQHQYEISQQYSGNGMLKHEPSSQYTFQYHTFTGNFTMTRECQDSPCNM